MQLVTGAAGMNGRTTVAEFVRAGLPVRALVRSAASAARAGLNRMPGVEVVEGDMMNVAMGAAVLEGVERVLMISSAAPEMVETQCRFIDSCRKAGVQHIIKFSGAESGIGFDPSKFRFARMHEEVEDYLEGSGVAWTHVRPSQSCRSIFAKCRTSPPETRFDCRWPTSPSRPWTHATSRSELQPAALRWA